MPDITFVNSPKLEKLIWETTRVEVLNGWFYKHSFLIVPELKLEIAPQIQVVFPEKFIYEKTETESIALEWSRVEKSFWNELSTLFPEAKSMHNRIQVDVVKYGTISSCYGDSSHYHLRRDRSIGDLAAMIVNRLLLLERKELGITWSKREALMDFVMTRPAMKKLFPKFHPIMNQLSRVPAKIRKESEIYSRSLGMEVAKEEFAVSKMPLPKMEKMIMKLFVSQQNELVSYDEMADSVWGEGEFKTFWAINKLVQRLRVRLDKLGIDGKRIDSVRGQGYIFK